MRILGAIGIEVKVVCFCQEICMRLRYREIPDKFLRKFSGMTDYEGEGNVTWKVSLK